MWERSYEDERREHDAGGGRADSTRRVDDREEAKGEQREVDGE
jgi:hypothetical protein